MVTIKSILFQQFADDEYATIEFVNGAKYFALVIMREESFALIHFNKKLVRISLPEYEVKVLREGVSIR